MLVALFERILFYLTAIIIHVNGLTRGGEIAAIMPVEVRILLSSQAHENERRRRASMFSGNVKVLCDRSSIIPDTSDQR